MSQIVSTIAEASPAVVGLLLRYGDQATGSGTGFLTPHGLVTADHVLSTTPYDEVVVAFDDGSKEVHLSDENVKAATLFTSPSNELDLAILNLDESLSADPMRLELEPTQPAIGTEIIVCGYPFGASHLSSHVGFVSAAFNNGLADVLQLDVSVNPANSGGPVVDTQSGLVVGYVTSADKGLTHDFRRVRAAIQQNVKDLSRQKAGISIGGVDPVQGLRATMEAMDRLAANLERSANVGIGYAYSARHILNYRLAQEKA